MAEVQDGIYNLYVGSFAVPLVRMISPYVVCRWTDGVYLLRCGPLYSLHITNITASLADMACEGAVVSFSFGATP